MKKTMLQYGWLFAAVFLFLRPAMAQRGAHRVTVFRVPRRAMIAHPTVRRLPVRPPNPVRPGAAGTPTTLATTRTRIGNSHFQVFSGSLSDLGQVLNPVPGLGFDYVHLAAMNQNLPVKALIDPVTEQEVALAERLFRHRGLAAGGFALFEPEAVVASGEQAATQPQPIIVIAQPEASRPVAPENPSAGENPRAQPPAPQPPLPDVGSFTLVLKDGRKLKASAFGRQGQEIVYITPDGLRKSFAASKLDVAATEKINEERGTPLRLSL